MLIESQGKPEKSQRKVGELCVKNLADTLLIENEKLVTSKREIAETLNQHFVSSVKELVDKDSSSAYLIEECNLGDPVRKILHKFRLLPCILTIKLNVSKANIFQTLFKG